jgi:hypothetical protein
MFGVAVALVRRAVPQRGFPVFCVDHRSCSWTRFRYSCGRWNRRRAVRGLPRSSLRPLSAIAIKLLPPAKAAALDRLLRRSDVREGFIDAASYPDEVIRKHDHGGQFSPWHYVNWPVDTTEYDQSVCKPECILQELPKQIEALQSSDLQAKALALSWVIHLVGDLHQPLHVADRFVDGHDDRGGLAGNTPCRSRSRATCGRQALAIFERLRQTGDPKDGIGHVSLLLRIGDPRRRANSQLLRHTTDGRHDPSPTLPGDMMRQLG